MSKITFILAILGLLWTGCGTSEMTIPRRDKIIAIDGKLDEWKLSDFKQYENGKLNISATYDDNFIYLAGQCNDRSIGRMFALHGLKIYIDPEGKNDKSLEMDIFYSGERKFDFTKGNFFASLTEDQKVRAEKEIAKIDDGVIVIDKNDIQSKIFIKDDSTSFSGQMRISENLLTFELKIPRNIHSYFTGYQDIKLNSSNLGISYLEPLRAMSGNFGRGMMRQGRNAPGMGPGNPRSGVIEENPDLEIWIKLNTREK
ncbi:MAG: hypothetical protein Q8858_10475 [Bacteroidota bacterium]|nr:hypothetical protein [Bacteroidota bacterium]